MKEEPRRIIVTGAGRGVGRATVRSLVSEHGVQVHAISRDQKALDKLSSELGADQGMMHGVAMDICAPDAAARLFDMFQDLRVHGLVHNAGALLRADMGSYTRTDLEDLYRINAIVPLELSQALAPLMQGDPPGHIVHLGSMGGFQDSAKFAGLAAYSSSKAALACMSQCIAEELGASGVRSNCLALGAVDTEMLRTAFPGYQAPVSVEAMGAYVARFVLEGHFLYNGKVLPVAVSTP